MIVNPYISFDGRCEAAFEFYEKCLGAKTLGIHRYEGSPMAGEMPADWGRKVMHASLAMGGEVVMMGSDATPDRYRAPAGFQMSVSIADPLEADRIFQALLEGGSVIMPIQKTFWTERFGMLKDQFGVHWMVNCDPNA